MDRILDTVKEICDVSPDDNSFDTVLKLHTNTVLFTVRQLGVNDEPFMLEDGKEEWEDFTDREDIEAVKSYVGLKVRKLFDPPTTSALKEALDESIKELEWRINVQVDPGLEALDGE